MKWACIYCGSVYESKFDFCTVCLEEYSIVPLPLNEKVSFERTNRKGCKGVKDIREMKLVGEYLKGYEELGRLPKIFTALLYGLPGSGKSTLALCMVNRYEYPVFFASIEEGFSDSFIKKLQTWEIFKDDIIVSDCKTEQELSSDLEQYKGINLVVIDSITALGSVPVLEGYSHIYISHSNKDGNYKGCSSIAHDVDIVINCKSGIGEVKKNRFENLANINIF